MTVGEIQWDNKKKTWNRRSRNLTCSNSSKNSVGEIQWDNKKKTWNRRSRNLTCNNSSKNSVGETLVCVLAIDLRLQRIQSHSLNSIITAMDSKHVATALSLCSCLCSCSWSIYDHSALNHTILRRHCCAQQTPNRTAKTHTESVLKNHFGGSQNWRLHRNTKTTSCHRLTRVATGRSLLHRPLPSPTPQNLHHRQTDVMNLYVGWCGQIWQNHFGDDSHLGYITKLEKETLGWLSVVWRRPHFLRGHVVVFMILM